MFDVDKFTQSLKIRLEAGEEVLPRPGIGGFEKHLVHLLILEYANGVDETQENLFYLMVQSGQGPKLVVLLLEVRSALADGIIYEGDNGCGEIDQEKIEVIDQLLGLLGVAHFIPNQDS